MCNGGSKRVNKRKAMQGRIDSKATENKSEARQKSEWIGKQLREAYAETLSEPVPERFKDLLRQLDEKVDKKK